MVIETNVGLDEAQAAITAMIAAARQRQAAVVACVVDRRGELVAVARMDGANLVSTTVAQHKAITAARLGIPSGALGEGAQLTNFGDPRITHWAGGLPIMAGGACIGAIGVSGLTNEEDEDLARIGLAAIAPA